MHKNLLRVDVSYLGGLAVVTVQGEVDMESASTLRVVLDQLEPHKHAYIDMGDVRFMDSSGIKVLVSQAMRMRESGGELHIQNPSRAVRRVIETVGLDEDFFESDDATSRTSGRLASFSKSGV